MSADFTRDENHLRLTGRQLAKGHAWQTASWARKLLALPVKAETGKNNPPRRPLDNAYLLQKCPLDGQNKKYRRILQ